MNGQRNTERGWTEEHTEKERMDRGIESEWTEEQRERMDRNKEDG